MFGIKDTNIHDKWIGNKNEQEGILCKENELFDEFEGLGCDEIIKVGIKKGSIYESDILAEIDNKRIQNFPEERQDFIAFANRVNSICKDLQIKYLTIEEEARIKYFEIKDKSKIGKVSLYGNIVNTIEVGRNTHYNNLKILLKEAYKYPRFFKDWKTLILRTKGGNNKAKNLLIKQSILSIVSIAKLYWKIGGEISFSELIQAGSIGVEESLNRYDPKIGGNFYSYASWAIRMRIKKDIMRIKYFMDVPLHVYEDLSEFQSFLNEYHYKNGKYPSNTELANLLNKKISTIKAYKLILNGMISLDDIFEEHGDCIEDLNTLRPDQLAEKDTIRANIDGILSSIFDEREASVLKMRYGLGGPAYTLEEVGEEIGVTRERARQIEVKSIERLRTERFYKMLGIEDEIEKLNDPYISRKRNNEGEKFRNTVRNLKIEENDTDSIDEGLEDETNENEDIIPESNGIVSEETGNYEENNGKEDTILDGEFNLDDEDDLDETVDINDIFNGKKSGEIIIDEGPLIEDKRLLKLPPMCGIPYTTAINLENYLQNITKEGKLFSLEDFINVYVDSLPISGEYTFSGRFNVDNKDDQKSIAEIAEDSGTSEANIFMREKSIKNQLDIIFTTLGNSTFGEEYIQQFVNSHYLDNDYGIIDYSGKKEGQFGALLMGYINSKILNSKYQIYYFNGDRFEDSTTFFIFKGDKIKLNILDKYRNKIDEMYKSDREEDKVYEKEILIARVISGEELEYYRCEGYDNFIVQYLAKKYSIYLLNNKFSFPKNKDTVKYKVLKVFNEFKEPVHFRQIIRVLYERYPDIDWSDNRVVAIISRYGTNLGNGMYLSKSGNYELGNIGDILEKYLSEIGISLTENEIFEYIKNKKNSTEKSIKAYLSKDNRFIKLKGGKIGLSAWGTEEEIKCMEIKNQIINILSNNRGKNFTKFELYSNMPSSASIDDFLKCLNQLVLDGKIGVIKGDITDFYYAL